MAMHVTGLLPVHDALWHVYVWLQRFVPVQAVPLGAAGLEHMPLAGSHVPATWHWSRGLHVTGLPAQVPFWHESLVVQALPSLQAVPFGAEGFEHVPLLGLHVPGTWH
jgi:hypothetical protein